MSAQGNVRALKSVPQGRHSIDPEPAAFLLLHYLARPLVVFDSSLIPGEDTCGSVYGMIFNSNLQLSLQLVTFLKQRRIFSLLIFNILPQLRRFRLKQNDERSDSATSTRCTHAPRSQTISLSEVPPLQKRLQETDRRFFVCARVNQ